MSNLDRDYIVDFSAIDEAINSYSIINSDITDVISKIKSAADNLYNNGWKGEAKDSFESKFNEWITKITNFNDTISNLEDMLNIMSLQAEEIDNESANLASYL